MYKCVACNVNQLSFYSASQHLSTQSLSSLLRMIAVLLLFSTQVELIDGALVLEGRGGGDVPVDCNRVNYAILSCPTDIGLIKTVIPPILLVCFCCCSLGIMLNYAGCCGDAFAGAIAAPL